MKGKRNPQVVLAQNIRRLMEHNGISQAEVRRKAGVGQATMSELLKERGEDDPSAPNVESRTVSRLAAFFGVPVWQLYIEDLPIDLFGSNRLTTLVTNYSEAPDNGRRQIERVAESEVKYVLVAETLKKDNLRDTGS
jgi:transcriptional regulator with XRE-family HTH domain